MEAVTQTANALMRAVAASGVIREQDTSLAVKVMREELKQFIAGPRYADERDLVKTGQHQLAFASLTTTCIDRIVKERS